MGDISGIGTFNLWNFLFYISIGLAIVYAVKINGVIPVFSYLIIPAVSAILLTKNNTLVFIYSFIISVLGGFFGLNFSLNMIFLPGPRSLRSWADCLSWPPYLNYRGLLSSGTDDPVAVRIAFIVSSFDLSSATIIYMLDLK
jgi:hypothetical protein